MKTLLLAGIAGILTVAPASAIAAIDSASDFSTQPSVDLSFASSSALAKPAAGAKNMPRMGKSYQMKNMGSARQMKMMGNSHQMKTMSKMRQMKGNRHGGSYVRQGRMGYDRGYNKPYRGFRLPRTYINPAISLEISAIMA